MQILSQSPPFLKGFIVQEWRENMDVLIPVSSQNTLFGILQKTHYWGGWIIFFSVFWVKKDSFRIEKKSLAFGLFELYRAVDFLSLNTDISITTIKKNINHISCFFTLYISAYYPKLLVFQSKFPGTRKFTLRHQ